jgi:hypothetical protein
MGRDRTGARQASKASVSASYYPGSSKKSQQLKLALGERGSSAYPPVANSLEIIEEPYPARVIMKWDTP